MLRLSSVAPNPSPELIGEDKLPSYSNYFLGRDSCRWRSFVPHYERVVAKEVWPGIDVEYLAHADGVETLFRVRPGADVSQIALEYEGLERPLEADSQGNLVLYTSVGAVKEQAPWAYQISGSRRTEVPVSFRLLSNTRYGLTLGQYDGSTELVIDPRVIYSTYFWYGEGIEDLSLDQTGNIVSVGSMESSDFPVTPGAYQDSLLGPYEDGFVAKLTADGQRLLYASYLGGSVGGDHLLEVVVDGQGHIIVGGYTESPDWPLVMDAFDRDQSGCEGVLVCLSPDGSALLYSTYIGSPGNDWLVDMTLDTLSGEVYVCGMAGAGFHVTRDAIFPDREGGDGYVAVFQPNVMQVVYSTYFGTAEDSGAIDIGCVVPVGNRIVWVAGHSYGDVGRLTPDGFQTTYGGDNQDGYFAECDLAGGGVLYGSYLGGPRYDYCRLIHLPPNRLVLYGFAGAGLPVTLNAYDTTCGGSQDGFVCILELPGTVVACTYVGGGTRRDRMGGGQRGRLCDWHLIYEEQHFSTDAGRP